MMISLKDNNIRKENVFYSKAISSNDANCFAKKDADILDEKLNGVRIAKLSEKHKSLIVFPQDCEGSKYDPCLIESQKVSDENRKEHFRFYTNNVMGFVGVRDDKNKHQYLRISSRFSKNDDDCFLYYMLQKVMHLNLFKGLDFSRDTKLDALDFLMLLFPHHLKEACNQGIFRTYKTFRYNDSNVNGIIDVDRHINTNVPFQGKIAYNAREHTRDNYLMQLVRHTIEVIDRKAKGKDILRSDIEIREAVNMVRSCTTYIPNDRVNIIAQNSRPVSHPFYTKYKELQEICLRILRNEKIGYGESNKEINGILFDGAWLWEEYIATILPKSFKHYTNKTKDFFLFREKEETELSKPFQWIIPDYLGSDGTDNIVADAKYIPLSGKRQLPAEQAEGVYYKTIMYMLRFKAKKAFLFYPYSPKDLEDEYATSNNQTNPVINDFVVDENENYHLYKVGLPIPEAYNFKDFIKSMKDNEKKFQKALEDIIKNNYTPWKD